MIEQILQADRYLQVDQVERARGVYQRVVDMDPGNAIAVVGLARCALAEGADHQAYELAAQALQIDPENEMARRMEARLSEVLSSRGETVERPDVAATPNPHAMRAVVTDQTTEGPGTAGEPSVADQTTEPASPASETEATPAAVAPPVATPTAAPAERPSTPTPPKPSPTAKERPVRKSLFDRLMGR